MVGLQVKEAVDALHKTRGIPKDIITQVLIDSLINTYKQHYGIQINVNIDPKTFEITATTKKKVVKKVKDSLKQISIEEAKELNINAQLGDLVEAPVQFSDLGWVAVSEVKTTMLEKIKEAHTQKVFADFSKKIGTVITGKVHSVSKEGVFVELDQAEGYMPYSERIPKERYEIGLILKFYIKDVKLVGKNVYILLSRAAPQFLEGLLRLEVPEIFDGIIEVKRVVREPGQRSKIAVVSKNPQIDPVGACIGVGSRRIQAVRKECAGERIDIINYSDNSVDFIKAALSPCVPDQIILAEDGKAIVVVPDNKLSVAIGREGQNVRLASKLTGWQLELKPKSLYQKENNNGK